MVLFFGLRTQMSNKGVAVLFYDDTIRDCDPFIRLASLISVRTVDVKSLKMHPAWLSEVPCVVTENHTKRLFRQEAFNYLRSLQSLRRPQASPQAPSQASPQAPPQTPPQTPPTSSSDIEAFNDPSEINISDIDAYRRQRWFSMIHEK